MFATFSISTQSGHESSSQRKRLGVCWGISIPSADNQSPIIAILLILLFSRTGVLFISQIYNEPELKHNKEQMLRQYSSFRFAFIYLLKILLLLLCFFFCYFFSLTIHIFVWITHNQRWRLIYFTSGLMTQGLMQSYTVFSLSVQIVIRVNDPILRTRTMGQNWLSVYYFY